jgi:uncharacterized protein (TIGR02996 family)
MTATLAAEARGLLEAIVESPGDDAPRLIYADWCEDHGGEMERQRAHAIRHDRVGVHAPQFQWWCSCPTLRGRFGQNVYMGRPVVPLHRISTFTESVGGELISGAQVGDWQFGVRGGFVHHIRLPLAAFMDHAAELFTAHPITRVVLTDREPESVSHGYGLYWYDSGLDWRADRDAYDNYRHWVPGELGSQDEEFAWCHDTPEQARAWLSARAVAFGRDAAKRLKSGLQPNKIPNIGGGTP